jgi:hypothetical protein
MAKLNFAQLLVVITVTSLMSAASTSRSSGYTYYISANGSDSNNGITKSTPWLHAPGMTNCSAVCSSTIPNPGDQFIFRGGETWHTSNGTVIGIPWVWTWSGKSTDTIYIGIDKTWFIGSAWSRPMLSMDNRLSTDRPESCTYDDTNITAVSLKNVHYVDFDGFELVGKCWSGDPYAASLFRSGSHITISNSYFHGWTMTAHAGNDTHHMILGFGDGVTNNVIVGNVFDGSDSSLGATPGRASGFAVYGECYDVHNNIFRRLSNGAVCSNLTYVHDNLYEYMYNSVEKNYAHGNVVESFGQLGGDLVYFYNNLIRHTNEGVTVWLSASILYNFNNIFYDIGNPTNCLMQSPPGFPPPEVGAATSHIYNNTFQSPCNIRFNAVNNQTRAWSGTAYFANNHFIGFASVAGATDCNRTPRCFLRDKGGEVFQSKAMANAQGYVPKNNYAPASADSATIAAGINLSSLCTSVPAVCNSTSAGVADGQGNTVIYPAIPINSRPVSSRWNAGAY